jgi:hypothetical protein
MLVRMWEEKEPFYTAVRNVNSSASMKISMEVSQKLN